MKPHFKPLATALAATLQLAALAAVPLAWDVRPGQPAPVTFDRYHGETFDFSATFRGFGELPFAPGADIRLWYQTNGMGQAWWSVPATIQSNVLSATWSPALDPGADRVSLFFGAPSNAYAAAVIRLRHSPGFAPGTMPDPETFHESDPVFTAWLSDTNALSSVLRDTIAEFSATGTVSRALTYGTPTRWTDATGCVWEVRERIAGYTVLTNALYFTSEVHLAWDELYGRWCGTYLDKEYYFEKGFQGIDEWCLWNQDGDEWWKLSETETNIVLDGSVTVAKTTVMETNIVARVALTNDWASIGYATPADATNAATFVSSSIVRYALVTPGEWSFSDGGSHTVFGPVQAMGPSGYGWEYTADSIYNSQIFETEELAHAALILTFSGLQVTATRASPPGNLLDRAVNDVSISSITNITLPALAHPGQARDFILLLDIPSSVTNTVPGLAGLITFTPSGAETVNYYVDGDDPSSAEFPVPTSPGTWSYSFTEFKSGWFAVSLKQIVEAVQQTQSQGGVE